MKTTTLTYPSYDDSSTVRALLWEPDSYGKSGLPRAVVQIVHGMSEHVERYEPFAAYLTARGFAVCANDHIGHGLTAETPTELGHMPLERGEDVLIEDVHSLRAQALGMFGAVADGAGAGEGVPYVIFGHSMGSFLTRVYLTRHAHGVRAAVICGTGQQPRALSAAGKALTRVLARLRGERHVSGLVHSLGAGAYGRAIKDAKTDVDWIALDPDVVAEYQRDPLCGQTFSVGAYHTLSRLVADATSPKLAARIPHSLPMLFIAGEGDPVGDFGRGVRRAAREYRDAGIERVDEILYPNARHEILNEAIKDQVFGDVLGWFVELGL